MSILVLDLLKRLLIFKKLSNHILLPGDQEIAPKSINNSMIAN